MSRIISNVEQKTPEWFALRAGKLTASVAHVITMQGRTKGSESTTRRDLRVQIALERVTGQPDEPIFKGNADTERGNALEAEALAAYEARTGTLLSPVGFVYRDDLPIGCSPDGAVLDGDTFTGGVDVKAPRPSNHLAYLRDPSKLVADYEAQVAHTLLVTGAPWWDLASYCPQMPPSLRLLIVRLVPAGPVSHSEVAAAHPTRTQGVDLAAHAAAVRVFLLEVDKEEADIRRMSDINQEAA
jgi:hypothetical protein